jgi:hypothetical protein
MNWFCRVILPVVFAVIAMPVAAQKPTIEQLESMLEPRTRVIPERPGFELPFYRWNDGAPIAPYIVTDGQTSPCVEIAREATQRQIDWMRRDVSALRNMRDVVVVSSVPKDMEPFAILIGLATEKDTIKAAMAKYALANRPMAKFVDIDSSIGMAHGILGSNDPPDAEPIYSFEGQDTLAIENDHIVQAYRWLVHLRGLRIYSEKFCNSIDWPNVFMLAGGLNFSMNIVGSWLSRMEESEQRRWRSLARSLFLRALYSCPSPATRECIVSSMDALLRNEDGGAGK